jgi:long-chain acyl-CoA synthetase
VGNERSYLAAILTGNLGREEIQVALDQVNAALPHYKRVRGFHISAEPFTIENGLLTANGKFKRAAILARYREEIEQIYRAPSRES